MSIEISRDGKSGSWSLSLKRNVFVALGLLFVTSGLATFSGPWWQGILVAILEKVDIVVDNSYQWLLGTIKVLIVYRSIKNEHFNERCLSMQPTANALADLSVICQRAQNRLRRLFLIDRRSDHGPEHQAVYDPRLQCLVSSQ